MLPADAVLDESTLTAILASGHSRIPVHKPGNRWAGQGGAGREGWAGRGESGGQGGARGVEEGGGGRRVHEA